MGYFYRIPSKHAFEGVEGLGRTQKNKSFNDILPSNPLKRSKWRTWRTYSYISYILLKYKILFFILLTWNIFLHNICIFVYYSVKIFQVYIFILFSIFHFLIWFWNPSTPSSPSKACLWVKKLLMKDLIWKCKLPLKKQKSYYLLHIKKTIPFFIFSKKVRTFHLFPFSSFVIFLKKRHIDGKNYGMTLFISFSL